MKKIKIKFVDFWPGFNPEEFFLTKIIREKYDVEITDDADYVVFCGYTFYDFLNYDQIRIMFGAENYVPDFNYVDYGISSYPVDFLDRHFSFPGVVLSSYDIMMEVSKKDRNYSADILKEKTCFVNLIASHESENQIRYRMLKTLGKYRRVESAGSFYNNMPGKQRVRMDDGTKLALQKKCKFTFCGESVVHEGFITEKIFDAFMADTIPIYYGSSTISDIVNKDAYIDIRDYDSLDAVLEKIIELDTDDEKYLKMLRQPVFNDPDYMERKLADLEAFVLHIFDQPLEKAYRRCKFYMPFRYEQQLLRCKKLDNIFFPKWFFAFRAKISNTYWKIFETCVVIKRKFIPSKME